MPTRNKNTTIFCLFLVLTAHIMQAADAPHASQDTTHVSASTVLLMTTIFCLQFPNIDARAKAKQFFNVAFIKNQRNPMNNVMKLQVTSDDEQAPYAECFIAYEFLDQQKKSQGYSLFLNRMETQQHNNEKAQQHYVTLRNLYDQVSAPETYEPGDDKYRTKTCIVCLPVLKH